MAGKSQTLAAGWRGQVSWSVFPALMARNKKRQALLKPVFFRKGDRVIRSNDPCGEERFVGSAFVEGLEGAGRELHADVAAEFRHPDAFVAEVRLDGALHPFGDVLTDTTFLLGFTTAVNFVADGDADSGDLTNFSHDLKRFWGEKEGRDNKR